MSVIDGGTFKCYDHETPFETVDPAAWNEHVKQEGHNKTESGSTACVVCGNPTSFVHKPVSKKAVCDKCKEDLK